MLEGASESAPRCAAAARGAVPAAQGAPQAFAGVAAMCEASPGARPALVLQRRSSFPNQTESAIEQSDIQVTVRYHDFGRFKVCR